jgi:transcriptional regulator with XRE-family HTH domain
VFRIESGRSSPTVAVLEKFARALAIEVRDLFPEPTRGPEWQADAPSATASRSVD